MATPKPVAERVSDGIEDAACLAAEQGDDLLADMLRAEAKRLREGGLSIFVPPSSNGAVPESVDELRAHALYRLEFRKTHERADELIANAWLREGYA